MRKIKSILGITLLETMLVLAVGSMVIVMSVRYYQSATDANNANVVLQQLQNITAAADNLAQGTYTYSSVGSATVSAVAGAGNMTTPYKSTIKVGSGSGSTYTVTVPSIPAAVCQSIKAKLAVNAKFQAPTCAAGSTTSLTYTYDSSK